MKDIKYWVSVEDRLPEISESKPFVEVKVRTPYGMGKMSFGYSGAAGESMKGQFWYPIREFTGDVHLENKVIDWTYIEEDEV